MDIENVVSVIVNLPGDFKRFGNISSYNLLKQSGYFETYNKIEVKDIIVVLNRAPKLVNSWMSWSEDKRADSGWFFLKDKANNYIVDNYAAQKDSGKCIYSNPIEACAEFIKREIESIRTR
jgi:hypothetical protein